MLWAARATSQPRTPPAGPAGEGYRAIGASPGLLLTRVAEPAVGLAAGAQRARRGGQPASMRLLHGPTTHADAWLSAGSARQVPSLPNDVTSHRHRHTGWPYRRLEGPAGHVQNPHPAKREGRHEVIWNTTKRARRALSVAATKEKLMMRKTVPRPFWLYCRLRWISRFITARGARKTGLVSERRQAGCPAAELHPGRRAKHHCGSSR